MGCLKLEILKNHKLALGEISKNPPAKIVRIDHFLRTKKGLENYYPFGMAMEGRNGSVESYRYGFNGMEKDGEVKGNGGYMDFGNRAYDTRLGSFMSLDRFSAQFPEQSPYLFAGNDPIQYIDFNGDFKISPSDKKKYPKFDAVLKGMKNYMNNHPAWKAKYFEQLGMRIGDKSDEKEFDKMFTYGKGPKINIVKFDDNTSAKTDFIARSNGKAADIHIYINEDLVKELEKADNELNSRGRNGYSLSGMQFLAFATIAHEGIHYLDIKSNNNFTDNYNFDFGNKWEINSFGNIPQWKFPNANNILLRYMKTPDAVLQQIKMPIYEEQNMGEDDFLDSPIDNDTEEGKSSNNMG